ncbi:MAG: protein translocase subunit SecD [Chlamydiota bacterium]
MKTVKRWHIFLILFVATLTIYNILPTIFYYSQPLQKPIDQEKALHVSKEIFSRIDQVDQDTRSWIHSFCTSLGFSPKSLEVDQNFPAKLRILFYQEEEAEAFRKSFPQANASIHHPAKGYILREKDEAFPKELYLERSFASFPKKSLTHYLQFSSKAPHGDSPSLHETILLDRVGAIAKAILEKGSSQIVDKALQSENDLKTALLYSISHSIHEYSEVFGKDSAITKRHINNFRTSQEEKQPGSLLISALKSLHKGGETHLQMLKKSEKNETAQRQMLEERQLVLADSINLIERQQASLPSTPLSIQEILNPSPKTSSRPSSQKTFSLGKAHPFIKEMTLSWEEEKLLFVLHDDVLALLEEKGAPLADARKRSLSLLLEEIARIARVSSEDIEQADGMFSVQFSVLEDSRSILALDLWKIAEDEIALLENALQDWRPSHPELQKELFPTVTSASFAAVGAKKFPLGLALLHPKEQQASFPFLPNPSIYVAFRGLAPLMEKYAGAENSAEAKLLSQDIRSLQAILQKRGFVGYFASELNAPQEFSGDYIFENSHYFTPFLTATEEAFTPCGSKRYAVLELKDWEQRLLTLNKIETKQHEALIQERDDYKKALLYQKETAALRPKPQKSVFWNNLRLSFAKYFRGDERKTLKWGLDLCGGKSVTLSLHNKYGKQVVDPLEIDKGMQELEKRINRLGVRETTIRREGTHLVVDFPGSQNISAEELIQGSSMFFHVANEKFSLQNPALQKDVHAFLREVWNEAKIQQKTAPKEVETIACKHLYGEKLDPEHPEPRSPAGKILWDEGLRLALPSEKIRADSFHNKLSKVALYREDVAKKEQKEALPLCLVFHEHALAGAHLTEIQGSYDPSQGNFLRFSVKSSYQNRDQSWVYPKDILFSWTSQFAREKVLGTPLEKYTGGRGYRMCVLLNDAIISAPTLDAPIRDHAMISGHFSQKEIASLVGDLKAGSLSYAPKILSEVNVSPELGQKERTQGLFAVFLALSFVILLMSFYYRFLGVIASLALLFNLLMIFAALQNLGAALTLPGIAGIILTLGMAVDANVLVFERVREEIGLGKSLKAALHSGYEKAFSAIFDANITTMLAAMILLSFDSGPVKAFAITLIIGIASSMFSALFMTRIFFIGWLERTKKSSLAMLHLIRGRSWNFLGKSAPLLVCSLGIFLLGVATLSLQKSAVLGMEFTGGESAHLRFVPDKTRPYEEELVQSLRAQGVTPKDVQIRTLGKNHHLRVLLRPSFTPPTIQDASYDDYPFAKNPRLKWLALTAKRGSLPLEKETLRSLHQEASFMSAQLSEHVKNHAMMALFLAFVGIFIYLGIRFEYLYAASAVLCLLHDVLVSMALISILRYCGFPLQMDLQATAALMTIIGYSLNDTIVVFDRIREELKNPEKRSLPTIVNQSINDTFSRTMMTSLTTLIALLALVFFGGEAIFSFAFVMTVGVMVGTASSLFVAGPLLLYFRRTFAPIKGEL